ncbi:MAG: TatD family hydrolase [Deltaproteobacteria bacterium]|nr:TatD family hydrolase [Deltaproteobacteria bacterium]
MCELVLPAFGVHPWNASQYAGRLNDLSSAIEGSPILGEIGLDYHFIKDSSQYPAQREVFEYFLIAAKKQAKMVNLHTKGAEKDVLRLLERHNIKKVIVHWYSGPLNIFRELAEKGVYFTVGASILDSEHIRKIAREIPPNQLLTETDCPGGPRMPTGDVGTPVQVKEVVQALAELKNTTVEAVIRTIQMNFLELIQDDPRLSEVYDLLNA